MKRRKNRNFRLWWRWSLSCRPRYLLAALAVWLTTAFNGYAIDISAVYTSACQREIGVIVDVDDSKIRLLTLSGDIEEISRFNIIYIAYYPVGHIPLSNVINGGGSELVSVKSVFDNQIVDLVKGWMIDFSEKQISFLTLEGTETVIDVNEIWDIDFIPIVGSIEFPKAQEKQRRFVHPYPFNHCSRPDENADGYFLIYPQHLLEEPLLIKKELDRLMEGYSRLRNYQNDSKFYAVPQIYGNESILGVWINLGSRYGASKNRNNSFIPEIISEYSSGPFGFQHILITGSALMPSGVHEEPQIHFNYRLKADYVHFSIMLDFNRYVIGDSKYRWHKKDLLEIDNRENDSLNVSGGFDYGAFSIDLSIWNRIQYSVRCHDNFYEDDMELNKGGITFQNRLLKIDLYYGFGADEKPEPYPLPDDARPWDEAYIIAYNEELAKIPPFYTEFKIYRLNVELAWLGSIRPTYSLIFKSIDFDNEPNINGEGEFRYKARSITNSILAEYDLDDEIKLAAYLSLETLESDYGIAKLDESASETYPKLGIKMALVF